MKMKKNTMIKWRVAKLGEPDVANINMGQSPPGDTYNETGDGLVFYQGKADFGDISPTPRIWCSKPKKIAKIGDILLSVRAPVGPTNIANEKCCIGRGLSAIRGGANAHTMYIYYYLNFIEPRLCAQGEGSTFTAIGKEKIQDIEIPLPPLPVQEKIVQIIQKNKDIYRKREEALDLLDKILSASFINIFGDPSKNQKKFSWVPLGELAEIRSGVTKGRKLQGRKTIDVPYLRVANVQDGYLDLSEIKKIEVLPEDIDRYHLENGDILLIEGCGNPNYLGRGTIWRDEIPGMIHQNHIFRARTDRTKLLPEYLAALLQTQYANSYFLSCAKNSSGLSNINSSQVKALKIPLPPIELQKKFVMAVDQWIQTRQQINNGLLDAKKLNAGLMKKAFSGQLTAEWEEVNAKWIKSQVKS